MSTYSLLLLFRWTAGKCFEMLNGVNLSEVSSRLHFLISKCGLTLMMSISFSCFWVVLVANGA